MTAGPPVAARIVDPRAVRVAIASGDALVAIAPIVLEPVAPPLAPAPPVVGLGVLGGVAAPTPRLPVAEDDRPILVDDRPTSLRLDWLDPLHAVLVEGSGPDAARTAVLLLPSEPAARPALGVARREVVVDGWRFEVEIESERRASLLERARRGREATLRGGPTEVRAIIPGRVVALSIVPGDSVVAGQQLLVVEAMKMQNELRAPRDGVVSRVAVGTGRTIDVGDLLLVLE
jgi:biotin carboxyl carrier protein